MINWNPVNRHPTDKVIIQIRDVPRAVHKEARRLAFEQGISLNKWLIEALRLATQQTKSGLTAGKE